MSTVPPAQVDGSSGGLLSRTEPKVKASALAALLTPLVLYYLYRYVPGVASLPHELDVVLATLVTGGSTFAAGYLARAVDRVDLVFSQYAAKVDHTLDWDLSKVGPLIAELAKPVETAVVDAVHAVEDAASAGQDPVAAAEDQVPAVADAVHQAVTEAKADVAPAVEQAIADAPAVAAEVAATPADAPAEFEAMLRRMLAQLEAGTPIADVAQAAAAAVAPVSAPAPVDPPTAPMTAVAAGATPPTA